MGLGRGWAASCLVSSPRRCCCARAGYSYQALREENASSVRRMSRISGALGILMVVQTLGWLASLAVD